MARWRDGWGDVWVGRWAGGVEQGWGVREGVLCSESPHWVTAAGGGGARGPILGARDKQILCPAVQHLCHGADGHIL